MINNAKTDDRPKNGKTHCRRMNEKKKKQNKTKTQGKVFSCKLSYPFHNGLSAWWFG